MEHCTDVAAFFVVASEEIPSEQIGDDAQPWGDTYQRTDDDSVDDG